MLSMFSSKKSKVDLAEFERVKKERDEWKAKAEAAEEEVRMLRAQLVHAHHVVTLLVSAVPEKTRQQLQQQLMDERGGASSPSEFPNDDLSIMLSSASSSRASSPTGSAKDDSKDKQSVKDDDDDDDGNTTDMINKPLKLPLLLPLTFEPDSSFEEMNSEVGANQTVYLEVAEESDPTLPAPEATSTPPTVLPSSPVSALPTEFRVLDEVNSEIEAADAEVSRILEGIPHTPDLDSGTSNDLKPTNILTSLGSMGNDKTKAGTLSPTSPTGNWSSGTTVTALQIFDANGLKDTRSITASIYGDFISESEGDEDGSFWINDDVNLNDLRSDSRASNTSSQRPVSVASFTLDDEDPDRFQNPPSRLRRPSTYRQTSIPTAPQVGRKNSRTMVTPGSHSEARAQARQAARRGQTTRIPSAARPPSAVSNASTNSTRRTNSRPPALSPSAFSQRSGNSDFQSEPAWQPVSAGGNRRSGSSASGVRNLARRPSWASERSSDSSSQLSNHRRMASSPLDSSNYGPRPVSVASSRSTESTGRFCPRPGSSASSGSSYPTADPQWTTPTNKKPPGIVSKASNSSLKSASGGGSQKKTISKEPARSLSSFAIADESEPEPDPEPTDLLSQFSLDAADTSFDPDVSDDFGTVSLRASTASTNSLRSASVNSHRSGRNHRPSSSVGQAISTSGRRAGGLREFEYPTSRTVRSNSVASNGGNTMEPLRSPGARRNGDLMHVTNSLGKSRGATWSRA